MRPILMVDDDKDDQLIAERALRRNRVVNPLIFLEDGEELLSYLRREGTFSNQEASPLPCFILLDLNMPRMDGRKVLETIKKDPAFKMIPIVVFTTSKAEEDIIRSYDVGANSYITKPVNFEGLVEMMGSLRNYWLEIVELPVRDNLTGIGIKVDKD